jgi:predicted SprT family Zn-dependent metalloprotease
MRKPKRKAYKYECWDATHNVGYARHDELVYYKRDGSIDYYACVRCGEKVIA